MNKRVTLIIGVLLISSITIITIVLQKQNIRLTQANGFKRNFNSHNPSLIKQVEFPGIERLYPSNSRNIYLGGRDPRWGILTDLSLKQNDTQKILTNIPPDLLLFSEGFFEDNIQNIVTTNRPILIRHKTDSSTTTITKLQVPLLTRLAPISSTSMVARSFDTSQTNQIFVKLELNTGKIIKENPLFRLNNDGGFSTDGILNYDYNTNTILYIQFYQNIFYALDSNLNFLYKSKTIDTINTNTSQSRAFSNPETNKGSRMSSVPLKRTHNGTCVGNGRLYVLGSLHADNESPEITRQNTVVDIYEIKDGNYISSFYIPNINGKKISSIQIINDTLITLTKGTITTWKLP